METGSQVSEIWQCFKEYIDKKHIETVAERFVDLCADFGTPDGTKKAPRKIDFGLKKGVHSVDNLLQIYVK